MILILMGVSGAGKTTVGKFLAEKLGWPFYEGDDFHPAANIEKMRHGIPLNNADRLPWLQSLREFIERLMGKQQSAVLTCSALKTSYRQILSEGLREVRFVYLKANYEQIYPRLVGRKDHFMPPELLQSQFETLEVPENAIVVDASGPAEPIATAITKVLQLFSS